MVLSIIFINYFIRRSKYKTLIGVSVGLNIRALIGDSLFVAVFTGIVFICIFNLMDKPKWLNKLLDYLGNHSTNLWLTHMFLYIIYFKEIVFAPKYSFLIFIWLVILCLISSHLINLVYKQIINLLNKRIKLNLKLEKLRV